MKVVILSIMYFLGIYTNFFTQLTFSKVGAEFTKNQINNMGSQCSSPIGVNDYFWENVALNVDGVPYGGQPWCPFDAKIGML